MGDSYECMVRCIKASPGLFAKDPLCWLHLAENCIACHSNIKRKNKKRARSMKSRVSKIPNSRIDSPTTSYYPKDAGFNEIPNELGSQNDLDMIGNNPLPRSLDCLNHCLRLCEERLLE